MESKRRSRDLEKDLEKDLERDLERDLSRDAHRAEWTLTEQKLEDDIRTLRQQLLLLVGGRRFLFRPWSPPHPLRLHPSSRTDRGLPPTTGATPCWSRRRWTQR